MSKESSITFHHLLIKFKQFGHNLRLAHSRTESIRLHHSLVVLLGSLSMFLGGRSCVLLEELDEGGRAGEVQTLGDFMDSLSTGH